MSEEVLALLTAWVLPWAKETHPDWYKSTLTVASNPKSFRAYLLRLAERRWEEDKDSRIDAPIMALEHTNIVIEVKDKRTGETLQFAGRRVKDRSRAIAELAMRREDWEILEAARREWDLVYVSTE